MTGESSGRGCLLAVVALGGLFAACGDGSTRRPGADAGTDGGLDAGVDAGDDAGTDAGPPCLGLGLERITNELSFPVYATAPAGDDRIFVLERTDGLVRILDADGTLRPDPFLDVSATMDGAGYEAGLLSLAFHPDYATNGFVYVTYTTLTATARVSRFVVPKGTPDAVDPLSETLVIEWPQLTHHNTSGMLLFGPDGKLYVAIGDDDVEANGQDPLLLASKILRLDVDVEGVPYEVPADNPFVGDAAFAPETWIWGLREPYRFWFDAETDDLYVADVGNRDSEELDVVPFAEAGGKNFGWPIMEGTLCHTPPEGCDQTGLEPPAYEYIHEEGAVTAIIGAVTYHGAALSECWRGRYFFGDYPGGWLRTLAWDGSTASDVREDPDFYVSGLVSFGTDGNGEILVVGYDETLDRIVPAE